MTTDKAPSNSRPAPPTGPSRPDTPLAETAALLTAARAIFGHRRFEDAAQAIFDSAKELLGATAGYVALSTREGKYNEVVHLDSGGRPCGVDPDLAMPIRGLRAKACETGQPVYDNEFADSQWMRLLPAKHMTLDNVLFAPLMLDGKAVGLLGLACKPGGFTDEDARLASAFGGFAAIALKTCRDRELLESSEERFRQLAMSVPVGIFETDAEGNCIYVNDRWCFLAGISAERAMGAGWTRALHPEDREKVLRQWTEFTHGPTAGSFSVETRFKTPDGRINWVSARATALRDAAGNLAGHIGTIDDITEHKRADEALAWRARVDASIAELSEALIQETSLEETSALVLRHARDLTGSEFGYVGYIDPETGWLVCPTHTQEVWDVCRVQGKSIVFKEFSGLWGSVLKTGKPLLTNAPEKDPRATGTPEGHIPIRRFLSAPAVAGGSVVGQVAVANGPRDYAQKDMDFITRLAYLYALAVQRARTDEEIRRLANFPSENPNPVLRIAEGGTVLYGNNACGPLLAAWRCGPGQQLPEPWHSMVGESLNTGLADRTQLQCGERTFSLTFAPVPEGGYVNVYALDITERNRAEEQLREARDELEVRVRRRTAQLAAAVEELQGEVLDRLAAEQEVEAERQRLFTVLDMLPGFVTLKSLDHRIRFANRKYRELFDLPKDQPCHQIHCGADQSRQGRRLDQIIQEGDQAEWECNCIGGRAHHVWAYPFSDVDGTPAVLQLCVDITERKELEKLVIETSETERRTIGRDLHDTLGQKLTGLAFLIKGLARKLGDKLPEEVGAADQIVQLVNDSISQVRFLARGLDPMGLGEDRLADGLRELAANTSELFGIPCKFRCDDPVVPDEGAVATHLYHIAQEAVTNATRHAEAKSIAIALAHDARGLYVSVEDDGVGIPSEAERAAGMGLRVMRYRADVIGGALSIERRSSGGTVVECVLPRASISSRGEN